jgi:hypothetical protein
MSHTENCLQIPPDAASDPKSVEMVRAWIIDGGLQCSLQMGIWEDVRAWGILLADIARYVADAQGKESGMDHAEVIAAIRTTFEVELDNPTSETEGDFV